MNRSVLDSGAEFWSSASSPCWPIAGPVAGPASPPPPIPRLPNGSTCGLPSCSGASGLEIATGVFRAMMKVALVNDGPVTFLLDSRKPT